MAAQGKYIKALDPSRIKLAHKGILLLSIPLAFELIITGTLWTMFRQAEEKAHRIDLSRECVVKLGNMSTLLLDASTAQLLYLSFGRSSELQKARNSRQAANNLLIELKSRIANDSDYLELVAASDRLLDVLKRGDVPAASDSAADRFAATTNLRRNLQAAYQGFKDIISKIGHAEKLKEGNDSDAQERIHASIEALLLLSLIGSVVLTASISYIFYTNILRRINVLTANSARIGARQELLPLLTGTDEISGVDSALHKAARELAEAEQERSRTISMLSHDLRSPLVSLQAGLGLLAAGICGALPEQAKERVDKSEYTLERLIAMITDYLDLESLSSKRADTLRIETKTLGELFDEASDSVLNLAQSSEQQLRCHSRDTLLRVDAKLMIRVLSNLLANAIKFSPKGAEIQVTASSGSAGVRVSVKDRGCGIEPEFLPYVFEPFKQAKEGAQRAHSSGLGLAICKEIIEKHGGKIGVDSVLDRGTTIWFELPSAPAQSPPHSVP